MKTARELAIFLVPAIIIVLDWFSKSLFGLGQDYKIDGFGLGAGIYHFVIMPTKTVMFGNWIRIKKKENGDHEIEINLDPESNIDFKETIKKVKKKEHRHKHET